MIQTQKRAIICGTNTDSIGRYAAEMLIHEGYEVWLYSRHCTPHDVNALHERRVDITNPADIASLLDEVVKPDLLIMAADTGTAFGTLGSLSSRDIKAFIGAKIEGSVIFVNELLRRNCTSKLVWLAGSLGPKDPSYFLYGPTNVFIGRLVDDLNCGEVR